MGLKIVIALMLNKKPLDFRLTTFTLDERLKSDCLLICEFKLCKLLLLNDNRWPWLVLVPRIYGAVELHDLSISEQIQLQEESAKCARVLAAVTNCEKINTGALGNIVRQLHVHVIARNSGDSNWPGPAWGYGERIPYAENESAVLINSLLRRLN